jgi:hypothetical protein
MGRLQDKHLTIKKASNGVKILLGSKLFCKFMLSEFDVEELELSESSDETSSENSEESCFESS